jgi:hypothetical protein
MRTKFVISGSSNRHTGLLKDGKHKVFIKQINDDLASASGVWLDRTPQLRFIFNDEHGGYISYWANVLGYFTKDDLEGKPIGDTTEFKQHPVSGEWFLVSKESNRRIENPFRTETCLAILQRIANCCGMPEVKSMQDLVGAELMITVKHGKVIRTDRINTPPAVDETIPAPVF